RFLLPQPDVQRSAVTAGRDAHGRDLLRVEQREGPTHANVERGRSQARRPDVVLLGQLHLERRSQWHRARALAGIQGSVERQGDGLRGHATGRAGGTGLETGLLCRGVSASAEGRHELTWAPPHTPARSLAGALRPAPLPRGRAVRAAVMRQREQNSRKAPHNGLTKRSLRTTREVVALFIATVV